MKPAIVADVGNTRIKWGRCAGGSVVEVAALPPDDAEAWQMQLDAWHLPAPLAWAVSSVHPQRCAGLVQWLNGRGDSVLHLDSWTMLPLRVEVDQPAGVGMDRLLNAVAANSRRGHDTPAIIVDAGSAVTVDWVDANGAFTGGAIFPGLRLMALALHDRTALLPLVTLDDRVPPVPGKSTIAAIRAGLFWSVVGGIRLLVDQFRKSETHSSTKPVLFLTGGDALLLENELRPLFHWPEMTLEGIRLAAEVLP